MPLLVLVLVAVGVAAAVAFATWHYPTPMASPTPSLAAAKAMGRESRAPQSDPSGDHEPPQPRGRYRTRLDGRARRGTAWRRRPRRARLPRADELAARRSRCQRCTVGRRPRRPIHRARADRDHATRRNVARLRAGDCCCRRRLPTTTQPLASGLSPNGARRSVAAHQRRQRPVRPSPADAEPNHRDARAVVSEAVTRPQRRRSTLRRPSFLAETPARGAARSWSVLQPVSPSPWPARAFSSMCIGSPTPSRGLPRLGLVRGLQPLRSVDVASSASALRPRRQCTRRMRRSIGSWRSEFLSGTAPNRRAGRRAARSPPCPCPSPRRALTARSGAP